MGKVKYIRVLEVHHRRFYGVILKQEFMSTFDFLNIQTYIKSKYFSAEVSLRDKIGKETRNFLSSSHKYFRQSDITALTPVVHFT